MYACNNQQWGIPCPPKPIAVAPMVKTMHEYVVDDQLQRTQPEFRKIDGPFFFRAGSFAVLLALPLTISMIFTDNKTFFDGLWFVIFLLVDLVLLAVILFTLSRAVSWLRQKRTWLKASASAQATIAKRKMKGAEEQSGHRAAGWSLGLAAIPPQAKVTPEETIVWVNISEAQYRKYANRNKVGIRYSVENPFVFLLEDEV